MADAQEHDWERHPKRLALRCRNCPKVWEPDQRKPKTACKGTPGSGKQ